ncbi:MAG: hypothetical protein QNK19_04695 [Xanthomonadales bacterium]|nr:hypothetical protein [Xanthomonadales bacterium]
MRRFLIVCLMICLSTSANAALIGLVDGDSDERSALLGTLTSMGHTVTTTIDGNLDLIISAPGNDTSAFAGVPYLQISDWGSGQIANAFASHPQGTPVLITIDGTHPILTGVSASWTTFGFWHYGFSENYIGWATGIPGLADAEVLGTPYSEVLAATTTDIYIGWNVYGPDATGDDLVLLSNSIQFLITGGVTPGLSAVPVPTMNVYGLILVILGLFVVASRRLRTSVRQR